MIRARNGELEPAAQWMREQAALLVVAVHDQATFGVTMVGTHDHVLVAANDGLQANATIAIRLARRLGSFMASR